MRRFQWLGLAAVAAIPAGLLIAFAPRGGGVAVPKSLGATVAPLRPLFGDTVTARVEAPFDIRRAQVTAHFEPFTVVAKVREPHAYVFRLQCLSTRCLTYGTKVKFRFEPAVVRYRGISHIVAWPPMTAGSRLSVADLRNPHFKPQSLHPPRPSFRLDPGLLGWSMIAFAGLLIVGTGGWGTRELARRRPQLALAGSPPEPIGRDLTRLERALEHVARALPQDAAERRKALDELALALDDLGSGLATQVRWLAWSNTAPERWTMKEIADRAAREAAVA